MPWPDMGDAMREAGIPLLSLEGVTTPDCTRTSCTGCGICPTLHAKNVLMGDRA